MDLLIVYTDEVGSTPRDCGKRAPKSILSPRVNLFRRQLQAISRGRGGNWKVLKSVGDSLVLSYEFGNAAAAVNALFDAWCALTGIRKRGRAARRVKVMRVAVHRPMTGCVARGDLIKRELIREFGSRRLSRLWKSHTSLDDDLFGMEMNLAARLATLPSDAAFVINENVLSQNGNTRREVASHLAASGYYLSPRIPVPFLKGFGEYLGLNGTPSTGNRRGTDLWCVEILPRRANGQEHPLLHDSRQYCVLRSIMTKAWIEHIKAKENRAPKTNDLHDITDCAQGKLVALCQANGTPKGFGYHVDLLYPACKAWQGPAARQDREPPPVGDDWLKEAPTSKDFLLTHVMISSVFDDNVDRLMTTCLTRSPAVKESYQDDNLRLVVNLYAESVRVYGRPCWLKEAEAFATGQAGRAIWMIMFQVKGSFHIAPDDPEIFSALAKTNWPNRLQAIGWGMLVGQADGYVLLRAPRPDGLDDDQIVNGIEALCKRDPVAGCFPSRVIPLNIRKLVAPVYGNPLPEVQNLNAFGGYGAWKRVMDAARH